MRRQISWLVIATTSAVVVSFVIPLCLLVRTLAEDRASAAADQDARDAAILVAELPQDPRLASFIEDLNTRGPTRTSVLMPDGSVLGAAFAMAGDAEVTRAAGGAAYRVRDSQGLRILLPVVGPDGTAVVRTATTEAALRQGVGAAWAGIIGLGLVLLLASLLVARWLGARVSRPLVEVAEVAHRLRGGELEARARPTGTAETHELARALNGLADRTTELLAHERAAVADLSHRLRTPVTALRLDAEAVLDPTLRHRLAEHVGALQRAIDQIVREARRPVRTDLTARSDAARIVRERVGYWSALAEDQGRTLEADLPATAVVVSVAAAELGDLVDILIDNVFAHTPEGTSFGVSLRQDGDRAALAVSDTGSGAAPAPGTRTGSTGLGLDIARRTAASVGGTLSFDSGEGGTRVEVVLPVIGRAD